MFNELEKTDWKIYMAIVFSETIKAPVTVQTVIPQRLYSVQKTCQRAVGHRKLRLKILKLPVKNSC